MDSATPLLWISGFFSALVSFVLEIGLLVVALGPVRRHRPEASMFLAGAAGLELFVTAVRFVAPPVLAYVIGASSYMAAQAVLVLFTTLVYGASGVLILLGVLRLAVPANRDPTRYE